jgi:hypothetical protein
MLTLRRRECNRLYQAKLREEKLTSWKDFCSSTDSSNLWNEVYRYAAGRLRCKPNLTTLIACNDTYTTDMQSTINQLLDHFVHEGQVSDEAHQKSVRQRVMEPLYTEDDAAFTTQEIQAVLEKFDPCKAPDKDALNSEILLHTLRSFPTFSTKTIEAIHIITHSETGKEGLDEAHKYGPICLINIGGKVLEKLLINRINHNLHYNSLINQNQYGFLPQKSTVDAPLVAKVFANTHLQQRNYVIMISLNVMGAFNAAWWPSILDNLR